MKDINKEDTKYDRARAHVQEIREFYTHLITYVVMVPVFLFINYYTTSFFWAIFPIIGWGIGVLSHAACTFDWNPFFNKDWEKRKIDKYLRDDSF